MRNLRDLSADGTTIDARPSRREAAPFRRVLVLGLSIAACLGLIAASCAPSAPNPVQISKHGERHVCVLPTPDNNGRVLGHDSGWSVDAGTYVYHLFGDTYVDSNGDGVFTPGAGEFRTGTIARTTDKNASDCVNLEYKVDANGFAAAAIPPGVGSGAPSNECLTWPESAVKRSDGKIFLYYTSVQCVGASRVYSVGIAEMTDVAGMNFTRRGILWSGNDQRYSAPVKIGSYVYTFGTDPDKKLKIARVPQNSITTKSAYTPLSSNWSVHDGLDGGPPSIAYNQHLGRFVATYSCAVGSRVCARVASTTGKTAAALRGAWGAPVVLRECVYTFDCSHVGQHPAYANGSKIYLSTNRHDGVFGTTPPRPTTEYRYWNTLREYDLRVGAPPASRSFGDAELEFGTTQGANEWRYRRLPASGPLTYQAGSYWWQGSDPVGGIARPVVFADGGAPGPSHDAVRVRRFPTTGTVTMSYEARLQRTCGNGVTLRVDRIRNGQVSQMRVPVNLEPGWTSARGVTVHNWSFAVNAGDQVAFIIASRGDAACDSTVFHASHVYDA